jgi:hypothetical protein
LIKKGITTAIEDLQCVSLARHRFVVVTTLPVRRTQNDPDVVLATGYVDISTPKEGLADSSVFFLPRQIAGNRRESWGLLQMPQAKHFNFIVLQVGTEIAFRKEQDGHKVSIDSVIDRTIHFPTTKGYG